MTVWDRISALMTEKGVSSKKLAEISGVVPSSVTKWSKGASIRNDALQKIAIAFGKSTDWLLTGQENAVTKLVYGMREMLFEAKGATGLSVQELAEKMGVDVREVERVMNEGGGASIELTEAFEEHLIPLIKAVRDKHFSTGKNSAPSARAPFAASAGCAGCAEKAAEIAYLREQLAKALDRIPKVNG